MKSQILSLFLLVGFFAYGDDKVIDDKKPEKKLESSAQNQTGDDSQKSMMPKTLNTLGQDDSGNWVLKRVWWEKAEKVFGTIMSYNSQVSDQQMNYFGARNDVDKQLDEGKRKLNLSLLDISKVISYLLGLVGSETVSEADEAGNSFKGTVLENKEKLESLQADIELLHKLDEDLDSVIVKVIDQTHKCSDYEAKAWEDFKQIGRVLNDMKAKELYGQVVNYRKNIKAVLSYLQNDLKSSFDALMAQAKNKISDIEKVTKELHSGGIDLVYELKAMDEGVSVAGDTADDQDEEPAPKKSKKASGIWAVVLKSLKSLLDALLWLPRKFMGLFGVKF